MIIIQYINCLLVAGAIIGLFFFLTRSKLSPRINFYAKFLSIILAIIFVIRYMSGDDMIRYTLQLTNAEFSSKFLTFISLMLNWFLNATILLAILSPFFNNKTVKNILKFFGLPVAILSIVFLKPITIGIVGNDYLNEFNFRAILLSIEIGIVLAITFITFWQNGKFKITKNEAWKLFYIIPMLLAIMPSYAVQGLFGLAEISSQVKEFNLYHRFVIYIGIILPFVLFFVLRKKDKQTIKLALLYITLGTLISFSLGHKFESFLHVTNWPFHLCNTAMYLIPLCLFFKWDKLFYFTYFINVFGAFIAMIMPNYSDSLNLFDYGLVNFYINHFIAFFMPLLIVALRVYDRPRLRQFTYSMIGFGIYFLLALIFNAWFSNYGTVDYFFINSDFVADKLGQWAEDLRNVVWQFNIGDLKFVFYPIYQSLFFLVYVLLGLGMWFIFEWCYSWADFMKDLTERRKKIKVDYLALQSQLNGRNMEEPINMENTNKLILKDFCKTYGNNKMAVNKANLVVNGGEVFGFLGPNGAGKSTIIKSIVGIQPITSGNIEVCGYDVESQPVMAKRNIGFVPDHYALYENLTGREYINYIADLYGVTKTARDEAINKYVTMLELKEAFDNPIKTYSHGMKQKITIISALVHDPKVWILDEPLTGLDPNSIYQVKECMKEHARRGNIVFFSSHIMDVVEKICDRIAIIKKGVILKTALVQDIEKDMSLEEFYLSTIENKNVEEQS